MKHYHYKHMTPSTYASSVRLAGTREELAEFIGLMAQKQTAFEKAGWTIQKGIRKVNDAFNGKKNPRHPPIPQEDGALDSLHICMRLEQTGESYTATRYMWGFNYKTDRRVSAFERKNRHSTKKNNALILSLVLIGGRYTPKGVGVIGMSEAGPSDYLEAIERELETGEQHIGRTPFISRQKKKKVSEAPAIEEEEMPVLDEDKESKPWYHYGMRKSNEDEAVPEEDADEGFSGLGSLFG